jgi:hypothetical protein
MFEMVVAHFAVLGNNLIPVHLEQFCLSLHCNEL